MSDYIEEQFKKTTTPNIWLAVDFDSTLTDHAFPDIGKEVPYAFDWLRKYQLMGAEIILYTMRSSEQMNSAGTKTVLEEAVEYVQERGIKLFGINENPEQYKWSSSNKVYANYYIDDLAIGTPLIKYPEFKRKCVNWTILGPMVQDRIIEWKVNNRINS